MRRLFSAQKLLESFTPNSNATVSVLNSSSFFPKMSLNIAQSHTASFYGSQEAEILFERPSPNQQVMKIQKGAGDIRLEIPEYFDITAQGVSSVQMDGSEFYGTLRIENGSSQNGEELIERPTNSFEIAQKVKSQEFSLDLKDSKVSFLSSTELFKASLKLRNSSLCAGRIGIASELYFILDNSHVKISSFFSDANCPVLFLLKNGSSLEVTHFDGGSVDIYVKNSSVKIGEISCEELDMSFLEGSTADLSLMKLQKGQIDFFDDSSQMKLVKAPEITLAFGDSSEETKGDGQWAQGTEELGVIRVKGGEVGKNIQVEEKSAKMQFADLVKRKMMERKTKL